MALPILANYPTFELTIPSNKRKIQFRPFIVAEQKVLLMALETKNEATILNAITTSIDACVKTPGVSIANLTTFDVEYIFLQIRAKSVGERANINLLCGECKAPNTIQIDLEKIDVDLPLKASMSIKLNDQYTINMRYPKYKAMLLGGWVEKKTATSEYYDQIIACLDSVETGDEIVKFDDEPPEEIDRFLASLLTSQFQPIMAFVDNVPRVKHPADFKCTACGHDNKYTLEGISDFF